MVRDVIIIAVGCVVVGIIFAGIAISISVRLGINIWENFWILAIPAVLAITLNIIALELYHRFKKKKG